MKGIIIPGFDPKESHWEDVVWGIPPDKPGRIVKALQVALDDPDIGILLFWGEIKDWLVWKANSIKDFSEFQDIDLDSLYEIIYSKFRFLPRVKNTQENMIQAKKIFSELSIKEVIIITSPDHLPRAMKLFMEQIKDNQNLKVWGTPSAVPYRGGIEKVEIKEG